MLYIASVIHIPTWAIQSYNKLITNFIWDNKPPKIKYTTLIAPLAAGGLNLQDLQTKIEANKVTWIKKLLESKIKSPWKAYLQLKCNDPLELIPLAHKEKYNYKNLKEKFYCDMLNTWAKINYRDPTNVQEILQQHIWSNDLIKIDNKPVRYTTWQKAGITYIMDLLNNNGQIASINFLIKKYAINIKQHDYNSLLHSIPRQWKKKITTADNIAGSNLKVACRVQLSDINYEIEEITTRTIYYHLIINYKSQPPTSKKRWLELYDDMQVGDDFWAYIYQLPTRLTKNSKVLMTQYKIIHRIIAVNHNLKKWKRIDSDKCLSCDKIDTIEHFIYECPNTLQFWNTIHTWWKSAFLFSIPITLLEVIFGIPNEINDNTINIYNLVILQAKHYIYTSKKKNNRIDLFEFLLILKQELILKKNYYLENNRIHIFTRNWGELLDNL
jgi:hypothetical protein